MTIPGPNARQRLLEVTERILYRSGITATGMDTIVKESGVSRKTIYNHFASKEILVAQVLRDRDERWMAWFIEATSRSKSPAKRLLSIFDALEAWFRSEDFNGCAFINAAGEIGDAQNPIRVIAMEHKARLLHYLRQMAEEYGAKKADVMASELLLLIDGAITVAKVMGNSDAARDAKQVAKKLFDL